MGGGEDKTNKDEVGWCSCDIVFHKDAPLYNYDDIIKKSDDYFLTMYETANKNRRIDVKI